MLILTTRKLRFYAPGDRSTMFTSMGGGNMETAPDWITEDPYFALCKGDGHISAFEQVATISAAKPEAAPAETTPETPEETATKKAK